MNKIPDLSSLQLVFFFVHSLPYIYHKLLYVKLLLKVLNYYKYILIFNKYFIIFLVKIKKKIVKNFPCGNGRKRKEKFSPLRGDIDFPSSPYQRWNENEKKFFLRQRLNYLPLPHSIAISTWKCWDFNQLQEKKVYPF